MLESLSLLGVATTSLEPHMGTFHKFLQILRDNALTVLNSWSASAGPTYVHCEQVSRIDYICVRQFYADGEAKNVKYLWHSPFLNQTAVGHAASLDYHCQVLDPR